MAIIQIGKQVKKLWKNYKKKNYSVKIDALLKTIEPIMLLVAGFFVLILATSAYSKYVETLNSLW